MTTGASSRLEKTGSMENVSDSCTEGITEILEGSVSVS